MQSCGCSYLQESLGLQWEDMLTQLNSETGRCWALDQGQLRCSYVLVRITAAVMKHYAQKQIREKKVYSAYTSTSQFITEAGRTGAQKGQEPGGRS